MRFTASPGVLPEEARLLRTLIFIEEQGFVREFDDLDDAAVHIVAFGGDKPIGTCRYYPRSDGSYAIGRIAVAREYRGKGVGSALVLEAERRVALLGAKITVVSAQLRAAGFYRSLGYTEQGSPYPEEHVPHILMVKGIENTKI
ncbi:MAG TPA: GNAT family N-acetyltransferase [Candidatus Limadaptatus stercoripullorum]|uniref:GNAT family N-acetyltransferase n=1 Tax=Candidatus Limadaptatus stercoripullorum TaxID=2840846 RepID=A0A9D1N8X6_9FIRM|nr:GNAT family N-acetyltransferase [Candidatus Limadaptatus stercoripullorum]